MIGPTGFNKLEISSSLCFINYLVYGFTNMANPDLLNIISQNFNIEFLMGLRKHTHPLSGKHIFISTVFPDGVRVRYIHQIESKFQRSGHSFNVVKKITDLFTKNVGNLLLRIQQLEHFTFPCFFFSCF